MNPRSRAGRLGVVAIIAAVLGVSLSRRRVREAIGAQLAMMLAGAWALLTLRPAFDLFPFDDWVGDIADMFEEIWRKVKRYVRRVLERALDLVLDVVTGWLGNVWYGITLVWGGISAAASQAWQWVQEGVGYATWFASQLAGQLWGAFGWLSEHVDDVFSWAQNAVSWVYGALLTHIDNGLAWLAQQLWNGILGAVNIVLDGLRAAVNAALDGLNSLVCGVRDLINLVADSVGNALQWIYGTGVKVASIVLKCLEWLVWFAAHPFDWFIRLFDHAMDRGSEWFTGRVAESLQRNGGMVESVIERWMGL